MQQQQQQQQCWHRRLLLRCARLPTPGGTVRPPVCVAGRPCPQPLSPPFICSRLPFICNSNFDLSATLSERPTPNEQKLDTHMHMHACMPTCAAHWACTHACVFCSSTTPSHLFISLPCPSRRCAFPRCPPFLILKCCTADALPLPTALPLPPPSAFIRSTFLNSWAYSSHAAHN